VAKSYETLEAWQWAIELARQIYCETKKFPQEEMFGITSQIRRAIISVSSNIAEGFGRSSAKERRHFVELALGSLNEVESLLLLSWKLGFIDEEKHRELKTGIEKEGRLLGGLLRYISLKK